MRVNILFSQVGPIPKLADLLAKGLAENGNVQVTTTPADTQGTRPIPCAAYDLVILGCPTLGWLGGKLPPDLSAVLPRCTGLDGKTAAAFVNSRILGSVKSLRTAMGLLEKQGAMVEDFAAIGGADDASIFAERLVRLLERRRQG